MERGRLRAAFAPIATRRAVRALQPAHWIRTRNVHARVYARVEFTLAGRERRVFEGLLSSRGFVFQCFQPRSDDRKGTAETFPSRSRSRRAPRCPPETPRPPRLSRRTRRRRVRPTTSPEPGGSRRARRRARRRRARRRRRRRFGSRTGGSARRAPRRRRSPRTLAARTPSVRRSWTAPTTFAPAIAKKARGRHAFFSVPLFCRFVLGSFSVRKDSFRRRRNHRDASRRVKTPRENVSEDDDDDDDVVGVDVIGVDAIVVRVVRVVRLAARARARVRVGFRLEPRRFRKRSEKVSAIRRARRSRIRSIRSAPASRARASRRGARRRRGARPPRAETATPERGDRFESILLAFREHRSRRKKTRARRRGTHPRRR